MAIKVLFVEKEVTTADLWVPSLKRKRYQVSVAHTRRQAISRSRSLQPDILIVDVASFGAAGYDVVDAIHPLLDGVPMILMLEEGHAIAGSQAEAFMTPPFTSRRLLYRLREASRSWGLARSRDGSSLGSQFILCVLYSDMKASLWNSQDSGK
jgi:DNA-binding response OmpR family regulator